MKTFLDPLVDKLPLIDNTVLLLLKKHNECNILTGNDIQELPLEQKRLYTEAQAERLGIQFSQAEIIVDLAEYNALEILKQGNEFEE